MRTSIRPAPSPEEAAAIVAALASFSGSGTDGESDLERQRWRLAGLMGSPPPEKLALDGSLWSYSSWKGMV